MDRRDIAREECCTHNSPRKGTTSEEENLSCYFLFSGGKYAYAQNRDDVTKYDRQVENRNSQYRPPWKSQDRALLVRII